MDSHVGIFRRKQFVDCELISKIDVFVVFDYIEKVPWRVKA